jgi:hypothetical protein
VASFQSTRRHGLGLLSALACGALVLAWLPARAQTEDAAPVEAQVAAEQWLAETDAGNHRAAWALASPRLRGAISLEQWLGATARVLTPLGGVRAREANGSKATRSLPGAPDGDYVIFSYLTDFANKAGAIETMTLAKEADGQWRVVGYFVR